MRSGDVEAVELCFRQLGEEIYQESAIGAPQICDAQARAVGGGVGDGRVQEVTQLADEEPMLYVQSVCSLDMSVRARVYVDVGVFLTSRSRGSCGTSSNRWGCDNSACLMVPVRPF